VAGELPWSYKDSRISFLPESSRTNLLLRSEQFDDAYWQIARATVTANNTTAPNGDLTADNFQQNSSETTPAVLQRTEVTTLAPVTVSIFAKANGKDFITLSASLIERTYFNLINGTIGDVGANHIPKITELNNGWYRCEVTDTTGGNGRLRIELHDTNGGTTVTDSGGVFIWGAQLEVGSFASTYIPTTDTALTRNADVLTVTGASGVIGQEEGTLFAEVDWRVFAQAGSPVVNIVALNVGADNTQNGIFLGIERSSAGTNRVFCFVRVANVTQAQLFGSTITSGRYKIALAYKQDDFALYVNGVSIATDTSGTVPATSEIRMGTRFNGDAFVTNDTIYQTALFPTRLSNAELETLTTI
jgi:hypothetical protein